ncbi:hypothetical protein [Streptomyces lavenduligriseus]|uniref:Uncharacterized protein n=1 Tax=Streptomyces lavenduligriseus TaxID=67315 RepID=A0ABT0P6M6_9ACTN|nr:hypothetical protein [Streptomyces lavenduligriseus]MCL3999026.1 hypothetical protein [Streptomyces lavenduligriseus]
MSNYFMSDEPRPAPFNADDLKPEHAKALGEFLEQVSKTLSEKHPADSFEGRAARTLREAVGVHLDTLHECFDDEEPETLKARKQAWNRLVWLVWPWEGTPGYDARQWRVVLHTDADDAVEGARRLLASREAAAQKRRAELEAR